MIHYNLERSIQTSLTLHLIEVRLDLFVFEVYDQLNFHAFSWFEVTYSSIHSIPLYIDYSSVGFSTLQNISK